MPKNPLKGRSNLKKVYVTEETISRLFAYKYTNRLKNVDEVIQNLLDRVDKNSGK